MRTAVINVLAAIAIAYAALIGILYFAQRGLMYHPGGGLATPAASGAPELSAVSTNTADGLRLVSWYHAAADGRPTLVYFHGNAGAIDDRGGKVRPYLDVGWGVLLAGYRGYGGNPGSPTEAGLYADAEAALTFLRAEGVRPGQIIVYGESLGSGVAVEAARRMSLADRPVGAVVLEAPFTSMADAAASHYPYAPTRLLVRDKYESLSKIDAIGAPLFVFHGDRDRVVPIALGKRLFEAASSPKEAKWIAGAAHSDLYDFGAGRAVLDFVSGLSL